MKKEEQKLDVSDAKATPIPPTNPDGTPIQEGPYQDTTAKPYSSVDPKGTDPSADNKPSDCDPKRPV